MTTLAAAMEMGGDPALRDRVLREAERNFERARATLPSDTEAELRRKLRALILASAQRYRENANVQADLRRCAER